MIEIERKFLVHSDRFKANARSSTRMTQGFLNTDPLRTVRVRVEGDTAMLTVKGKSSASGMSRFEWEHPITVEDANTLIQLSETPPIEKIRYRVPLGQHTYEVDEFLGSNKGLVIAEIELASEEEFFERPNWLGEEITGITKYYNSQLSKNPYNTWKL